MARLSPRSVRPQFVNLVGNFAGSFSGGLSTAALVVVVGLASGCGGNSSSAGATGGAKATGGSSTGSGGAIGSGGSLGSGGATTGTGGSSTASGGSSGGVDAGTGGSGTGTDGGVDAAATGGQSASGGAAGSTSSTGGAGVAGASGSGGSSAGGQGGTATGTGGMAVACQAPMPVTGTAVTVAVNLGTIRAVVDPDLMGVHTSVYDNHMGAPTTPPLLRAAGVRNLRYPGGSYGDLYHWSTHTATTHAKGTAAEGVPYVATGTNFGQFIALMESIGAKAMITVNYGSNPQGTGPGVPQEAAAWVAYSNGDPASTTAIGTDATGTDWKTVGYWAGLRAAAPLPVDDGQNFLRISHPLPVGIKYWEVGNELYGNGYYYGGEGWEEDLHLLHNGTARRGNANLSPVKYGEVFPSFAQAMKAVDPTVKVGAVLHWPYNEYAAPSNTDWNDSVLSAGTCAAMDFGVNHWYAGSSLTDLLTRPRTDIPGMFTALQAKVRMRCPTRAGTLPLTVTEWGPNYLNFMVTPPAQTQLIGIFAADSYANFMEQGAVSVHWLELHNASYLSWGDMTTPLADEPAWGYKGQQMASYLANGGDTMVQAMVQTPPAAFANGLLQAHASKHANGSIAVMLVNTSPTAVAAATINITGFAAGARLPCVGTRYIYAPVMTNADGPVTSAPVFSSNDATNRVMVNVPAYSVAVVSFPAP